MTDIVGGGAFDLLPGEWSDDTAMALCLAESFVVCGGSDPRDQMDRYLHWLRDGYNSCTGESFDIGDTTRRALTAYERTGEQFSGPTTHDTAGNGSLMRLAPAAMAFALSTPERLIPALSDSSRTTHGAPEAIDACLYFGGLLAGALNGASKEDILSTRFFPHPGYWERCRLSPRIDAIAAGSFKGKDARTIRSGGYVVETLEAALWAFHSTDDFRSGALAVVNLGYDADSTGAVYGQIAGAHYGASGIPDGWRAKVAMSEKIEALAGGLLTFAHSHRLR